MQFWKLEFIGYFVEKRLCVHVQRMLKMRRVYTLAELLSKIFVKKTKENLGPYLRSRVDKSIFDANLFFIDHCLHDLRLNIRKMLTYREMVNFHKWDFFRLNCVTTGARKNAD